MKNKKILTKVLVVLAACFMFASFSPSLDGRAVVVEPGVFPQGLFAKTVGYLPGDIISVANITGETTVDLLVIGALDPSEGVAIMLSPEAADAIGIDKDANNIVKITKRSGQDERVYGTAIIAKQNPGEVEQDKAPVIKEEEEAFDVAPATDAFIEELPEDEEEEFVAEEEAIPEEEAFEDESDEEFEEELEAEADSEEEFEEEAVEEEAADEDEEAEEETPAAVFVPVEDEESEEELEEEYEAEALEELEEDAEEESVEDEAPEEAEETSDTEIEEEIGLPFDEEAAEEEAENDEEETEPEESFIPVPVEISEEAVDEEVPELLYEEELDEDDAIDAVIESELEDYEEYDESEETEEYEAIVLVPVDAVPPVIETVQETVAETEETSSVEMESAAVSDDDEVEDVEELDEVDENAPIIIEPVASTEPAQVVAPAVEKTAKKEEPKVQTPKNNGSYEKYMVGGLGDLQSGKYYIQLAALSSDENIMEIVNKYSKNYPITIVPMAGGVRKQVMVGPLSMDEYAVVLERFKSYGYKDAFLRKIK